MSSKSFAETLQALGVKAESVLYEGKTHTDIFLQVMDTLFLSLSTKAGFLSFIFYHKNIKNKYHVFMFYLLFLALYIEQDPMRGGKDEMFEDIVTRIHADDPEALAKDLVAPPRRRLVPEFMLKLARAVSPF